MGGEGCKMVANMEYKECISSIHDNNLRSFGVFGAADLEDSFLALVSGLGSDFSAFVDALVAFATFSALTDLPSIFADLDALVCMLWSSSLAA